MFLWEHGNTCTGCSHVPMGTCEHMHMMLTYSYGNIHVFHGSYFMCRVLGTGLHSVGARFPAALITMDGGTGDTRRPLAELSVCSVCVCMCVCICVCMCVCVCVVTVAYICCVWRVCVV